MNKLLIVVFCALVAFVACIPHGEDRHLALAFTKWMRENNKAYTSDEFGTRWAIFRSNVKWIQAFNAESVGFSVAVNQFADLSNAEFNLLYKGLKNVELPEMVHIESLMNPDLPASVDWRTKGVVTGIKNQGQCGSCWSFSTTGSLEGAHALNTGSLVSLSEQNLVDCSGAYGNDGCDGGLMTDAFNYIIANGGIDTEASYPYTAQDGTCQWNPANCGSTLKTYSNIPSGSEASLQDAIATQGPVSVAIDASRNSFQFYSGGVYYDPNCSSTQLDHGVLAVGYGAQSGQDYYIVKNSWGASWGLAGYILMSRNRNNNCGIATMASWPSRVGANNC